MSTFNELYKEVYLGLFEEEAPLPTDPDAEDQPTPEETSVPQNLPPVPGTEGEVAAPEQVPVEGEDQSQLPDPKAQARVGIDTLNAVINLFQKSPNEQKVIIDRLKEIAGNDEINDTNFKDALSVIRNVSPDSNI